MTFGLPSDEAMVNIQGIHSNTQVKLHAPNIANIAQFALKAA